jgi:peptidoglycan/LPS O-acetylase OafA/YrhL
MQKHAISHYRPDIDGLRAIAVGAVFFFHCGWLPSGYLGVDVFFVISGFLVTSIVLREIEAGRFTLRDFYIRRIRRILPLEFFVVVAVLLVGMAVMLPDDLENLSAAAIATNVFSNNVLQAITTANYWDVSNEYKPLLHTWSLGVEEQFYLIYPLLLAIVARMGKPALLAFLFSTTAISIMLSFLPTAPHWRFYLLPFRFYEMSIGGVGTVLVQRGLFTPRVGPACLCGLMSVMLTGSQMVSGQGAVLATVALTLAILCTDNHASAFSRAVLENKATVGLGLISYSVYMWHQPVLAFARYFLFAELHAGHIAVLGLIILGLSVASYAWIESPFRTPRLVSVRVLLTTMLGLMIGTTALAGFLYARKGIIRDVPELDLTVTDGAPLRFSAYNSRIYRLDRPFTDPGKVHVLVVGDSFARDFANILLESRHADRIEVSYIYGAATTARVRERANEADLVFVSTPSRSELASVGLTSPKVFAVGTKSFGASSGIFYNHPRDARYFAQRARTIPGILEQERKLAAEWGTQYISLLGKVLDADETVPVFTPTQKFISRDCRHLTIAGAKYFASVLDEDLTRIIPNK